MCEMPQVYNRMQLGSGDFLEYITESQTYSNILFNKYTQISNIKSIINRPNIYPRMRIFVLNPDETVRYQIPNIDILATGSYNENYQNGVRRTFNFSLNNESGNYTPSIFNLWAGTKISLEIGVEAPEEAVILWFKRGVYVITNMSPSKTAQNKTVQVNCSDKFQVLNGKLGTVRHTFEIPVGTDIKNLIQDTLLTNTGDGNVLDPIPCFYHPIFEGKTTPTQMSISAGDTYGSLFIKLADTLSAEIFYGTQGRLYFVPIADVALDNTKPNLFDYEISNLQTENFSFNMNDFVNCVEVVGANVNGHTYMATAQNTNPASPICVSRIGLRTAPIITDSNITTDVLAQDRADYELRRISIAQSSLNSQVFFNPLLSVNNIVTCTDTDDFDLGRERFLIQSISFSLGYDGLMSLSLTNLKDLPFLY